MKENIIPSASIADLMLADIWALGMIIFSMLNPSLKTPYIMEVRSEGGVSSQEKLKEFIVSLLQKQKLPLEDEKLIVVQFGAS